MNHTIRIFLVQKVFLVFLLCTFGFSCQAISSLIHPKNAEELLPVLNLFYPDSSLLWEMEPNNKNIDYSNFISTKDAWNTTDLPIYLNWKRDKGVEYFAKNLILGGRQSLKYMLPSREYVRIVSNDVVPAQLESSCNGYPLQWKKNQALLFCGLEKNDQHVLRIYNPNLDPILIPYMQILPEYKKKPMQIVFIVIDSLRFDALGLKGVSPNLDAFKKESISFQNHLVNAAWTRPSTTIFFTGQYASKSSLNFWDYPLPQEEALSFYNSGVLTLPQKLAQDGIHSTMIGNNPFVTDRFGIGVDYGFQSVEEFSRSPNDTLLIKQSALKYLRKSQNASSDRFLFLNFNDPHKPYTPEEKYTNRIQELNPEEFLTKDPRVLDYLGEVAFVDEQLGEIFREMKRLGFWEQSMIIVTSDHGEVMNENHAISLFTGTNTLFGHGQSLYQEDIHVPLIIKYPSDSKYHLQSGSKISALTRSIDLYPTILETAQDTGASYIDSSDIDGVSLNRILDKTEGAVREYYGETRATQAVQIKDWKLMRKSYLFHRLGFWKGYVGTERDYLFNLQEDPLEENPIWIDNASVVLNPIYKELKDKLESYSKPNSHYTIRISNPHPNPYAKSNLNPKTGKINTLSSHANVEQTSTKKVQIQIRISSGEVRSVHKMESEPLVSKKEFSILIKPGETKEFHFRVYPDIAFPEFKIWVDNRLADASQWGVGVLDLSPNGCFSESCRELYEAKNGSPNFPKEFRVQIWRTGNDVVIPGQDSELGADAIGILKKQGYIQ